MRLGVAEPAIKFENVQAGLSNDQSREKKTAKFDAAFRQGDEKRTHDFDREFILATGIPIVSRADGAHPARVRAAVSVKCALMIAGRPEHPKNLSAHQRMH